MKLPPTAFKVCALIVLFSLLGNVFPVQAAPAAATPISFPVNMDATVKKSQPTNNFGSETTLRLDTSPTMRTYLRFNVSGLNGRKVTSAKLRLYSLKASSAGLTVRKAGATSWSEGGITYKNMPALSTAIKSIGKFKANTWLEIDVSKVVKGEGAVILALTGRSSTEVNLAAREHQSGSYAPALVLTLAEATAMPVGVDGNWEMIFSDDFNGSSLDLKKWRPNWLASTNSAITKPINSKELSCYDPSQVKVADGNLKLSLVKRNCKANNGKTYAYASGAVTTRPYFTFTYGFMEARVWVDGSASSINNWPAFWADGTGTWPTTGEIDVFEGLSGKASWHYHYGTPKNHKQVGGYPELSNRSGWHVFAADWGPGYITYYYDGQNVGQVKSNVVKSKMFLVLNLGLADTDSPRAPSNFLVDYVRVWKKQ